MSPCVDACWGIHTKNIEVVKCTGLGTGGIVVAEKAIQCALGKEVAQDAIGREVLLAVTAGNIARGALFLSTTKGGGLRQRHGSGGRGQSEDSGESELHFDGLVE
jgi:hypothetical protein